MGILGSGGTRSCDTAPMERAPDGVEVVLHGGVANVGAVVRVGDHVLRPSNPHTADIHRFLTDLRDAGFDGVPRPVGVDPDGRERLEFVEGDVALPPFPGWFQEPDALVSVARLMARFHAASADLDVSGLAWSSEMVDPAVSERAAEGAMPAGVVVCHNDVCPENVVFRNGEAVALLDFDFAAPGRPVHDLSQFVRMCVPVADDEYAESLGFAPGDRAVAVRAVCDAYDDAGGELGPEGRQAMLDLLDRSIARSGEWVRAKAEAGHPGFIEMWASVGGQETYDRRRRWWSEERHRFAAALA